MLEEFYVREFHLSFRLLPRTVVLRCCIVSHCRTYTLIVRRAQNDDESFIYHNFVGFVNSFRVKYYFPRRGGERGGRKRSRGYGYDTTIQSRGVHIIKEKR